MQNPNANRYIVFAIQKGKDNKVAYFGFFDNGEDALSLAQKTARKPWQHNIRPGVFVYDNHYNHVIAGFQETGSIKDKYELKKHDKIWCHVNGWPR